MKKSKIKLTRILTFLAVFAVIYILYQLIAVRLEQLWFMIFCFALLVSLIIFYAIYNKGYPRGDIDRASLPSSWSEKDKDIFISECKRRERITTPTLMLIIAISLVFLFDIAELYFGDKLKELKFWER
ncbi:MAG: hypothetical protein SOZ62_04705 [Eubacteriales bacterium]|nr:hypothetical protein [Eubacteriales bacterium]